MATTFIGSIGVDFCNEHVNILMINGVPLCQMIGVETFLFQLFFDNYTTAAGPSDASPATSHSRRISVDDCVDNSSYVDPLQELNELR
jgi:hypothetical protein